MKKSELEKENQFLREQVDFYNDQRLQLLDKLVEKQLRISEIKAKLTPREEEVMDLVSKGFATRYIENLLAISSFTLRRHMNNIYEKLEIDGDKSNKKIKAVLMYIGEWNEGICSN